MSPSQIVLPAMVANPGVLARVAARVVRGGPRIALDLPRTTPARGAHIADGAAQQLGVWLWEHHPREALHWLPRTQSRSAPIPADLRLLRHILAGPRFHPTLNPWQRFILWLTAQADRGLAWLGQQLNRALLPLPHVGGPLDISAIPVAVLFLAAVAGGAYLLARGAMSRSVSTSSATDHAEPTTVPGARERAARAETDGDYRLAFRFLFLALLLELQQRKVIELRPGLTNRDYLRALRGRSATSAGLGTAMVELTDDFDRVWYGHASVSREDLDRYRLLATEVARRAGKASAA